MPGRKHDDWIDIESFLDLEDLRDEPGAREPHRAYLDDGLNVRDIEELLEDL